MFRYLRHGKVVPSQELHGLVEANVDKIIFWGHSHFLCKKPVEIGNGHVVVFRKVRNGKVLAAMKGEESESAPAAAPAEKEEAKKAPVTKTRARANIDIIVDEDDD